MFKELNPIIHSQLRLGIMTLLVSVKEADFNYIKEKTNATSGNISVQLEKLSNAGYIDVKKEFVGKKTRTTCSLTDQGRVAFEEYIENLKSYLHL